MSIVLSFPNIPPASAEDAHGALVATLRGALSEINSGRRYLQLRVKEGAGPTETQEAYDMALFEISIWKAQVETWLKYMEGDP